MYKITRRSIQNFLIGMGKMYCKFQDEGVRRLKNTWLWLSDCLHAIRIITTTFRRAMARQRRGRRQWGDLWTFVVSRWHRTPMLTQYRCLPWLVCGEVWRRFSYKCYLISFFAPLRRTLPILRSSHSILPRTSLGQNREDLCSQISLSAYAPCEILLILD